MSIIEDAEKLEHVLKMNKDTMTSTGVTYVEDAIKGIKARDAVIDAANKSFTDTWDKLEAAKHSIWEKDNQIKALSKLGGDNG